MSGVMQEPQPALSYFGIWLCENPAMRLQMCAQISLAQKFQYAEGRLCTLASSLPLVAVTQPLLSGINTAP